VLPIRNTDMCLRIALLLCAATLWAQDPVISTRVYSEPPGADFLVDGQRYHSSATFFWPEHSTHVLSIPQDQPNPDSQYLAFKEWQNSLGQKVLDGTTVSIVADSGIPYYKSVWTVYYPVTINLAASGAPMSCTAGPDWGKLYLSLPSADTCYATSQVVWGEAGKSVDVQFYVPPGFAFVGWAGPLGVNQSPSLSFVLNGPVTVEPRIAPAARVTLVTSPPGFQVYADHQAVGTPISFDWAEGSLHTVGAVNPQRDQNGGLWVFDAWSDGGAENHTYTVASANTAVTLTARFVAGVPVGVSTNPPGLALAVDGRSTTQANFTWGAGSSHTISAPAEQADSHGRHYLFRSWSNGGPATQEVTIGAESTGWTALYEPLNTLMVRTDPSGVSLLIDGAECSSPCSVYRTAGAQVSVSAPATAPITEGTRVEFRSWSDGAAALHSVALDNDEQTLTASYEYCHRLAVSSDPEGGSNFRYEPPSTDGYFAAGAYVAVIAQPKPGYQFRRWEGDLSGSLRTGFLKMTGPRTVRAVLDQVPYVAPTGVRNAAGDPSVPGVAPGSIIAIYGASLAPGIATGPHSPLTQTLANVTVKVADRLLGLYFVSPEQINALLPSGLAPGDYTLTVHWEGHAEVQAAFQAVRNAPGLFTQPVEQVQYALAARADGSLVSPAAPAVPGETITLYGTGFGPYRGIAPDGFAIPETPPLPLSDPVTVTAGGEALEPVFAGAAPGEVGVVAVRFRIPENAVEGALELRVSVNGVETNPVVVPVGSAKKDL
jgi:uncharacterized protein (TIGR03437 family)